MNNRFIWIWCQRCAVLLGLGAIVACGNAEDTQSVISQPDAMPIADVKSETELPGQNVRHIYYNGYLADVLGGDSQRAASQYREVLGLGAQAPDLGAQSALRLANWAEAKDKRRDAMDLAVRASILGADSPRIKSEADEIRLRIATTVKAQDLEVRGPKAGTILQKVSPEIALAFAEAEVLLAAYKRRRLQPRLEALAASVRGKRSAMERAIRAYREVASSQTDSSLVPEAIVASEFRIASLYYDYSLALSFELPPELDPAVARNMRSQLRAELRAVRHKAQAAYRRSLAVTPEAHSKEWRDAATLGLGSVEDIILFMK